MTLIERLTPIFRSVFADPALAVTPDLTADDVPAWDSLNHINLVVAIEEELRFEFTADELGSMTNVGDLLAIIAKRGFLTVAP